MTIHDIIDQALHEAKQRGLVILRNGAMYSWCKPDSTWSDTPTACCALGAVLIFHKKAKPGFSRGWYKDLCDILGVDTYWFWRFWQGFNNGCPLKIIIQKDGKDIEVEDKVSKIGVKLAKKYRG